MKKIISIIFIIALCSSFCFANANEEKYLFVKDYIRVLQHLKIIHARGVQLHETMSGDNAMLDNVNILSDVRRAKTELIMAKGIMPKYADSKDEMIKETAKAVSSVLNIRIENNEKQLKVYERALAPLPNEPAMSEAEMTREMSKILAESDDSFQLLMYCSVMVTHVLLSPLPDKKGLMSFLVVTSEQRKQIIKGLEGIFGDGIKDGLKGGITYIDSTGAILYQFLTGGHKSADER